MQQNYSGVGQAGVDQGELKRKGDLSHLFGNCTVLYFGFTWVMLASVVFILRGYIAGYFGIAIGIFFLVTLLMMLRKLFRSLARSLVSPEET